MIQTALISKISPIAALKNGMTHGRVSISGIRKGLLVFQFALTLIFMMGIGVLARQYFNVMHYNTGFNKENIVVIPLKEPNPQIFRTAFEGIPEVAEVSFSSSIPGTPLSSTLYTYSTDGLDSLRGRQISVDENFATHMGLDFTWGTNLSGKVFQKEQVLANETFMKRYGNLNKTGRDSLIVTLADQKEAVIVGVLKDYNHEPLNERIEPLLIRYAPEKASFALVTLSNTDVFATFSRLEAKWDELYPNTVFEARFLEQEISDSYEYLRTGLKVFGFLAFLALVISCLGLLGMVIYLTENRTKEVAIRKILGASHASLLNTLSSLFFKMWGIAIMTSIPIAYLFFDKFVLSVFNKFNEGIGAVEILLSLLFTLSLGLLAILWQTHKVVSVNPAENLRNE